MYCSGSVSSRLYSKFPPQKPDPIPLSYKATQLASGFSFSGRSMEEHFQKHLHHFIWDIEADVILCFIAFFAKTR